jgi:hypothetical protein
MRWYRRRSVWWQPCLYLLNQQTPLAEPAPDLSERITKTMAEQPGLQVHGNHVVCAMGMPGPRNAAGAC